jgi:hypothetical protein
MANVHYPKISDVWKHLPLAEVSSSRRRHSRIDLASRAFVRPTLYRSESLEENGPTHPR